MRFERLKQLDPEATSEVVRGLATGEDSVRAILEGRQPIGLSNATLLTTPLPLDWQEQKSLLGFA